MALSLELTLGDEALAKLTRLEAMMGTNDPAKVLERCIALADMHRSLEEEGYQVYVRGERRPENQVVIEHRPHFRFRLVKP